jgi:hypothetical protein
MLLLRSPLLLLLLIRVFEATTLCSHMVLLATLAERSFDLTVRPRWYNAVTVLRRDGFPQFSHQHPPIRNRLLHCC